MVSSMIESAGEGSTSSYSHISRASAAEAIQYLDSYAFPSISASTLSNSSLLKKRKTVSEVDQNLRDGAASRKSYRFSSMSGLSRIHRERARQRRKEVKDVSHQSNGKEEQAATFQPFSLPLLLNRLQTYTITAYSSKPEYCHHLDPVALAMNGWIHEVKSERDVVTCATCRSEWKAVVIKGLTKAEEEMAWRALDEGVITQHFPWCPWKLRRCHSSLYRVPVHSRMETLTEFIREAKQLAQCKGIEEVLITSNVSEADQKLLQALSMESIEINCLLLSLFGWKLKEIPLSHLAKDCILQCDMCSRKIGLWALPKEEPRCRTLDVIKEHKSYCPFVNGKTQSGHTQKEEEQISAWQQRLQVLIGSTFQDGGSTTRKLLLSQDQVRKMRSSDVLAKVKSIMM